MSYSIKEKEPTLACLNAVWHILIWANQCWLFLLNAIWHILIWANQFWLFPLNTTNTGLLRSGYVIQH
jgi:hypothetical protein